MTDKQWTDWIVALQSIAQAGLAYSKDKYDLQRFEAIREIAVHMLANLVQLPVGQVSAVFANDDGYQTPKIDTRAAIFQDDKILLVQEDTGLWSLPGGWCDIDQTIRDNTVKEVQEEAGLTVTFDKLIAIQDRNQHNYPPSVHSICKFFSLCSYQSGQFQENLETQASGYFSPNNLPPLATSKTTKEQIALCFRAYQDDNWQLQID